MSIMRTCMLIALSLAGLDALALAPPGLIEAMVKRTPTWEQMLARRQHVGYFSVSGQLRRLLAWLEGMRRGRADSAGGGGAGTPARSLWGEMSMDIFPMEMERAEEKNAPGTASHGSN